MASKLTLGQILSDMRAAGWSTRQIEQRTGVSRQTQWAIRTGRTSGRTYDTAIRQARRTGTKPPPKRITPVSAAKREDIFQKVVDTEFFGLHPPDFDELVEDVGRRGAEKLIREQLESIRRYVEGSVQPGRKRWFDREERWSRLTRRREDEVVFDDSRDQWFWYHGLRK